MAGHETGHCMVNIPNHMNSLYIVRVLPCISSLDDRVLTILNVASATIVFGVSGRYIWAHTVRMVTTNWASATGEPLQLCWTWWLPRWQISTGKGIVQQYHWKWRCWNLCNQSQDYSRPKHGLRKRRMESCTPKRNLEMARIQSLMCVKQCWKFRRRHLNCSIYDSCPMQCSMWG